MGRPSEFTQEMADAICERIADGQSLRAICLDDGMPSKSTVFKWLGQQEAFADQYARAREAQADALFDEVLDIADEDCLIVLRDDGGEPVKAEFDSTAVQRNKLRVDARKWMAGKLRPKVYGDKITQEHTGPGGGAVQIMATAHDENL